MRSQHTAAKSSPCSPQLEKSSHNNEDPAQPKIKINPWVGKIPWRREWLPTPVFLPGESLGQRNLACSSPWHHKIRLDWARFPSLLGEYSWFVWVFDINGYFYLYCKSNKYTLAVKKPHPSQIRNIWRKGAFSCLHSHSTAHTLYVTDKRWWQWLWRVICAMGKLRDPGNPASCPDNHLPSWSNEKRWRQGKGK